MTSAPIDSTTVGQPADIAAIVRHLSSYPGVVGCALVETATGMVWHHSGELVQIEQIGEAAVEFWRVHMRVSTDFTGLGSLQHLSYAFPDHLVALFPCDSSRTLILVCVGKRPGMAWTHWAMGLVPLRKALLAQKLRDEGVNGVVDRAAGVTGKVAAQ